MNVKKIILIIGIVVLILAGAAFMYVQSNGHDSSVPQMNNTTNITKNITVNSTAINNTSDDNSNSESSSSESSSQSEPEYGSDSYVEKWDEGGGSFVMDQPVKTDSDGNRYARVYHEDTGQSSWESMAPQSD
ncbi:MAG: hypothetical protein IJI96_02570 [Methanobrevibacter sp.]|nr:hypothetical protein [Methanobrevibacter sp.]MBQ6627389.1 hypothetical protein [Methanobrevibacter sp.]